MIIGEEVTDGETTLAFFFSNVKFDSELKTVTVKFTETQFCCLFRSSEHANISLKDAVWSNKQSVWFHKFAH